MLVMEDREVKDIVEIALDREVSGFSMDADFYDEYEMDSLGAVALVVEVQKRYKIRIPDSEIQNIKTGNQLRRLLEKLAV